MEISIFFYYIQDHHGDNREVWRAYDKKVVQRTQYYPFGLPWGECENSGIQPYKYNGKEFIEMHGYDAYDYGARCYDAAIGRWETIDPLAEKYYSISPYVYCANNPIIRVDKDGRDWDAVINHDQRTITIEADFTTYSGAQATQTLQNSAADWNAQSGKFNYVVGEGDNAISYSANFDITVNQSGNGYAENGMTVLPDNSNYFQERTKTDTDGNEIKIQPQGVSDGKALIVKQSQSTNKNVTSHEMGHNLGMEHTGTGLMKSTTGGTDLKGKNVAETLGHSQVGQGRKNSKVNAQLISRQEIGTAPINF